MSSKAERVVIGMDPHKRSATIEVMTADEAIVGGGRFGTDRAGYAAMLTYGRQWTDRVWAVEGCAGIGKHIANRLLADAEEVVDVPPKLSARARVSWPSCWTRASRYARWPANSKRRDCPTAWRSSGAT
jgi:transposase